jgi:uncharacterized glyoxalase superfamily protein PhnB
MMQVEIDFVVRDSLEALALYEKVFGAEAVSKTSLERGLNEAVFTLSGTRFHILDENHDYMLFAPEENGPISVWFNITVKDIKAIFGKAAEAGFECIQPVSENKDLGLTNSMQKDPFGYVWMMHEHNMLHEG